VQLTFGRDQFISAFAERIKSDRLARIPQSLEIHGCLEGLRVEFMDGRQCDDDFFRDCLCLRLFLSAAGCGARGNVFCFATRRVPIGKALDRASQFAGRQLSGG
jgi:hypothetical protein